MGKQSSRRTELLAAYWGPSRQSMVQGALVCITEDAVYSLEILELLGGLLNTQADCHMEAACLEQRCGSACRPAPQSRFIW